MDRTSQDSNDSGERTKDDVSVKEVLDCRGLNCPLPIIKTKKAIDRLMSGEILKMIATDPGSIPDVDAWTRRTGNELVHSEHSESEYIFFLRKK